MGTEQYNRLISLFPAPCFLVLVDTPGIPIESQLLWETSYDGSTDCGGIITVRSELGEPIHKGKRCAMVVWWYCSFYHCPKDHRITYMLGTLIQTCILYGCILLWVAMAKRTKTDVSFFLAASSVANLDGPFFTNFFQKSRDPGHALVA